MPDTRRRRGAHPKDHACFAAETVPALHRAVDDLSWLLSRGYSPRAATKLVGDRYALRDRQRKALQRCAASDADCGRRLQHRLPISELAGETVVVDGYNVLLTLETALSGGVLLLGRDGVFRDLAAMSAHYRRLEVTRPALDLLVGFFDRQRVERVDWYLDKPVSNSGRLKRIIEETVADSSTDWQVELTHRTDQLLIGSPHVVATADSAILGRCERWVNVTREIVEREIDEAWVVDLG